VKYEHEQPFHVKPGLLKGVRDAWVKRQAQLATAEIVVKVSGGDSGSPRNFGCHWLDTRNSQVSPVVSGNY